MMLQLTGLSGSGKTTLANNMKSLLENEVEIIDGDIYRKTLCADLGFSKEDRFENIRRLGKVAYSFISNNKLPILSAINPYEIPRIELKEKYNAKIVWIKCDIETLLQRDTKGLYKKAMLPDNHPDKIYNLTGINDIYEPPAAPDLIINTSNETIEESTNKLYGYIMKMKALK